MKGKTKAQKGITLIALIITIVVLLILAAVAISSIQNDGILGYAENAADKYGDSQKKEQSILSDYEYFLLEAKGEQELEEKGSYIYVDDVHPTQHNLEISLLSNTITDFSGVTVKRIGQNLLDVDSMVKAGATAETGGFFKNANGTFTLSKVGNNRFSNFVDVNIPAGSILKISASLVEESASGAAANIRIGLRGANPDTEQAHLGFSGLTTNVPVDYSIPFDVVEAYIWTDGVTDGTYVTFKDIQIAINTDGYPEYKPYNEQTVKANADGTVTGLTSVSPAMMITTDSEDVIINCKYKTNEIKRFYDLTGKTILNFGDSIFGNMQPTMDVSTYLEDYTGATVYNVAFGGCKMSWHSYTSYDAFSMYSLADSIVNKNFATQENAISNYSSLPSYYSKTVNILKELDFNNVDIITIGYGTNDFAGSAALDNINNNKDTTTFAGALRYSIETIKATYPNIQIVLCTPMYRFWMDENNEFLYDSNKHENTNGVKLTDFVQAEKDVGNEYNLFVIDNYYDLGINATNRTQYFPTTDGTHPNSAGRKVIAEHMAKKLYEQFK